MAALARGVVVAEVDLADEVFIVVACFFHLVGVVGRPRMGPWRICRRYFRGRSGRGVFLGAGLAGGGCCLGGCGGRGVYCGCMRFGFWLWMIVVAEEAVADPEEVFSWQCLSSAWLWRRRIERRFLLVYERSGMVVIGAGCRRVEREAGWSNPRRFLLVYERSGM